MPELSTIVIAASSLIVIAMILTFVLIKKRRHEVNTTEHKSNQTEIPTEVLEIKETVDIITSATPLATGDEQSQSIDSTSTVSSDTNAMQEEPEQRTPETTIASEKSPESNLVDLEEPNSYLPTNGLSEVESSAERSSEVTNNKTDSEINLPAKPKKEIPPESRGGARRGERTIETATPPSEKKQRARKPEIICWQQSRKWFIGVEVLINNGEPSKVVVAQASTQLTNVSKSRWTISNLFETVSILATNDKYELQLSEKQKPFLLFKLSGEDLNSGRRVRYATSGVYLVVTPKDWIRDENQSGKPQVPPSFCHLNSYHAHYFHLDSSVNERIAFFTPENEEIQIPNGNSYFDFEGCKIHDAHDSMGHLFGQNPPSLIASDLQVWRDVATIVIGGEGKNSNGWRTSFKPDVMNGQVKLLPYLQDKDAGWFFLRIYDSNDELIDSLDFRFARNLHTITIDERSALPGESGHKPVKITIECDDVHSCKFLPSGRNLTTKKVNETKVEIEVPAQPEHDKTELTFVSPTKSRVAISLLVERVWWTICKRDTPIENSEWQDKHLTLNSDHLKATSNYILRIRLPKPRWAKEVQIGFERKRARTYLIEVIKQTVDIPLNHLEGVSQLEDSSQDHHLFLWLNNFPEQVIALLSGKQQKRKSVQQVRVIHVRLNVARLLKYLNRLDRYNKDIALSRLLTECKSKWSSTVLREHRDTYLIETACVIALAWKLLKAKKKKVIGRRKGWIRSLVNIAESNPSSFLIIFEKYQTLAISHEIT